MILDEVMKMTDEELMLKVAELQGHKNLKWMPMPLDETEKMLFGASVASVGGGKVEFELKALVLFVRNTTIGIGGC